MPEACHSLATNYIFSALGHKITRFSIWVARFSTEVQGFLWRIDTLVWPIRSQHLLQLGSKTLYALYTLLYYWGEPERAPHRRVCCGISIYMYIYLVRRAVSHIRLLFCAFLRHSLIWKLFTNYSYSTQGEDTNRLATARTETTRGPTYSMARTIDATAWQKGFICRCHYLCCHSQWKSLVTWTDLESNGHIDEGYRIS